MTRLRRVALFARMGPRRFRTTDFAWLENLGAMIDGDAHIQASCTACGQYVRFARADLEALAAKVGRDFSLRNRRCRCRLTPGCRGWNRFFYLAGVYRPLWDEEIAVRWMLGD